MIRLGLVVLAILAVVAPAFGAGALTALSAERTTKVDITVHWRSSGPVDVFLASTPTTPLAKSRLLTRGDRAGVFTFADAGPSRPYIILRDQEDRAIARVAERLIVLERGSNFRDLGGYVAAKDKHVRWGMIYRTAAMPMLTPADYDYIRRLGLVSIVDLRSVEERQVAPDAVPAHTTARYLAVDYPASDLFPKPGQPVTPASAQAHLLGLYRDWPRTLAPQFRQIFHELLANKGPVAFHCSAGQDRTGVAAALVLTALGVPRDIILADYHLSTADRIPANEIPPLRPGEYPGNIVADFYLTSQRSGAPRTSSPLFDANGAPYLKATFDSVDTTWGSVDAYLDKMLGVGPRELARLRELYLES